MICPRLPVIKQSVLWSGLSYGSRFNGIASDYSDVRRKRKRRFLPSIQVLLSLSQSEPKFPSLDILLLHQRFSTSAATAAMLFALLMLLL